MNRRWICNDVWMDIFPSFDRAQLGLKLALLSPRFNALVDKHFDGKSELTIWRTIEIRRKDKGPETKLSVRMDDKSNKFVEFPLPDRPLPSKIRFKSLEIYYIDHFVIAFLRSNHQIFDKRGIDLHLWITYSNSTDGQRIWDIFGREIWPIFSTNIHRLGFTDDDHWIMKRYKIIGEKEEKQQKDKNWDNNCHYVYFWLDSDTNCIGPLSPTPFAEESGQSITKGRLLLTK